MKPISAFNNFNTYEWLDYHLSKDFSGADGIGNMQSPSPSQFFSVAGKGKLCKSIGLTGAEKTACKKNIATSCGKKGLFPSKAKKLKWENCASNIATGLSPEQVAKDTADSVVPTTADSAGLSTGEKVMIAVGVIGFVSLVGFAIANRKKSNTMISPTHSLARG